MKITITGSLGHISRPLTQELVQKGHVVTVISNSPGRQKNIEEIGASAAIGSLEDVGFLTKAFTGADAVYCMIPPNDYFDPAIDLVAHYRKIGDNYVQAIQRADTKRVVHLSSIGAHLEMGTGLILGHHYIERILNNLSNVDVTFMRPTAFYYNLYGFVNVIKSTGSIVSNYGGEDKVVWVSPMDIASAIGEEIVTPLSGRKVRYVASEELSCREVAGILGTAIGKPDLKWTVITDGQMQIGLESAGMAPRTAAGLVELNASMHTGTLFEDYYQNGPQVMGKVKLEDFAKEFAAVFNKND